MEPSLNRHSRLPVPGDFVSGADPLLRLVGHSESVIRLHDRIQAVSQRNSTVLLRGESGVGKELVAQQIHCASRRAGGPFVAVDCSTLRDTLFESQLFGHVKGAFTGAQYPTLGFWRAANGGTLFLDEIGELAPPMQAKLLRCLQDRAVIPVGGVDPIPVDVRVITATHRNLEEMVRRGEFREDLYFRIKVVRLDVPPLRERMSDVPELARYFLARLSALYHEPIKTLDDSALAALMSYDWPGNVRELANAIEYAHVLSPGHTLTAADLPEEIRAAGAKRQFPGPDQIIPLDAAERALILRALTATHGNQARAAQLLQIERRRLYRKVHQYGLESFTVRRVAPHGRTA
ncbi:MAG: sigma-54-dependent Fis family transcriptional regulator [Planctomycetes bacterium]|nr:sigma-54-dependent Fis family transcriptional regulator [Planctomycetota bacterium]